MITLIILILLSTLIYFKPKFIKKNKTLLYIIFTVVSIIAFIFNDIFIFTPWIKGFLGLAIFYLVMLTGALPNWQFKKNLMTTRTELSIIGFIVITPHAIYYLIEIIKGTQSITYFAIAAYLIMIPLFITSFITIRKKMSNKTWKNLQKLAYIVYLLLFIHIIIHYSLPLNRIFYILILIIYIGFKGYKIVNNYKTKKQGSLNLS
ncbi:MAG: ferric reductase-like transmembrane domain-containing protein [Candidatus Izimaplasma sp.]|nr:ferric reductase-like transmembrane domain-containing protein [Candidatus Izimaplasma bacterium]